MKKLKVVALLAIMMCGLVGCKEDVEVHTEYAKAQPLQLHIEEVVQETVEQAKVSAEIAMGEAKKEFSPYYVAVSSLNIRQAPDVNSSLVGSLIFGDCVNVYIDGEWAELDNGTYVSAECLTSELPYTAYAAPYTSGMKSYMPYSVGDRSIFAQSSNQYKLQELCNTGSYGIRQYNGRYCVAIGSYFGTTIGQYFDLILENGVSIPCIMADQKADCHTDDSNIVTVANGCMTEFVVDFVNLNGDAKRMGDISYCSEDWKSRVVEVRVYDMNALSE